MDLKFNTNIADSYSSNSQIARILTENWVKNNSYCPNCGNDGINEFENNRPVADFYCGSCKEEFELKSKNSKSVGNKIIDGAYSSMIKRINDENNPNFFFLTYDKVNWQVSNFMIIPKYFFVSDIIQKRKKLAKTARRAGWIGCNIDLTQIPESGRIFLVKNSEIIKTKNVLSQWSNTLFLKDKKGSLKSWILDVMSCIDKIESNIFSLKEVYAFEERLKLKYPNNKFIKDKIRQQLQVLRDKGQIEFKKRGFYQKINI